MNRTVRARSVTIAAATALTLAGVTAVAAAAPPGAYDRPGKNERVSVASNGAQRNAQATGGALFSDISADGRFVLFNSDSSNLVPGDTNLASDVFRRDRKAGRTVRVSVSSTGAQAVVPPLMGGSGGYSISADGRFVAFSSYGINLVPGDTNLKRDAFVRDLRTGRTVRVSVASNGTQGNDDSYEAAISANGRYVAFASVATNLVSGDTNKTEDVFVRDLRTGKTVRASVSSGKAQANRSSHRPSLSADGRYIAFNSHASNLTPGDDNDARDVFRRDLRTGKTVRISVASDGAGAAFAPLPSCAVGTPPLVTLPEPIGPVGRTLISLCDSSIDGYNAHWISADGRYVTFTSNATNLVPNDTNFSVSGTGSDTFVHDMRTGRTERVSVDSYGRQRDGSEALGTSISATGRYVVTTSRLSASTEDCAEAPDASVLACLLGAPSGSAAYVYDRVSGADESLAVSRSGRSPKPGPCSGVGRALGRNTSLTIGAGITPDGRYVSLASSGQDLVAGDTNKLCDYFVRDRGPAAGAGGLGGSGSASSPGPEENCVAACLPPLTASGSVGGTEVPGANLIDARMVPRSAFGDLFVRLDLARLPAVTGAPAGGLLYGLAFTAGGERYEARVQRVSGADYDAKGGASFGLFRQDRVTGLFTKVAALKGGYGTIGPSVVFAVPLREVGVADGGRFADVQAFTGVGSYLTGVTKVLDTVRLAR